MAQYFDVLHNGLNLSSSYDCLSSEYQIRFCSFGIPSTYYLWLLVSFGFLDRRNCS
jgi:hypothetical protein